MPDRLELADLLLIAEGVLCIPAEQLLHIVRISAAETALSAPFASLGGIPFYGDPVERAAICCSRIIRHNPLPDGNKRLGYECMREMLERGGIDWPRPAEDAEDIALAIERLATQRISEQDFVRWTKLRVLSEGPDD